MNKIIYFLIMVLFSCTPNNEITTPKKTKTYPFQLPVWVTESLDENSVVGISFLKSDLQESIDSARQQAAIQLIKNHETIVVSKYASVESAYKFFEESNSASFEYELISNPETLKKIYNSLYLVKSTTLFNTYYLALFSLNKNKKISSNNQINYNKLKPEWFIKNGLLKNNDSYQYHAKSSNLIKAFDEAISKSRIEIGKYLSKHVTGMTKSSNDLDETILEIKTIHKLQKLKIKNLYFSLESASSGFVYHVFIEMETRK